MWLHAKRRPLGCTSKTEQLCIDILDLCEDATGAIVKDEGGLDSLAAWRAAVAGQLTVTAWGGQRTAAAAACVGAWWEAALLCRVNPSLD